MAISSSSSQANNSFPALAGSNLNALLEAYGVAVEANAALRAVPHARSLHPAEPLVTDGMLTAALAAALGLNPNPELGAHAALPPEVAVPGSVPARAVSAVAGTDAAHGAQGGKPGAAEVAALKPGSAGRPGTAGSRRPGTAGARARMQFALQIRILPGRFGDVKAISWLPDMRCTSLHTHSALKTVHGFQ